VALLTALAAPVAHARVPDVQLAQLEEDDAVWALLEDSTDQAALDGFIAKYPNSRHAKAARDRLAALKAGTVPPPLAIPPRTDAKPPVAAAPPLVPPPPGGAVPPIEPRPAPPPVAAKPPVADPKPPAPPTVAAKPPPVDLKPAPPPVAAKPFDKPIEKPTVVVAATPTQPTQTYARPHVGLETMNGLRLDWCLSWERDCGKPAADAFCKLQGYDAARSFEKQVTGGQTWLPADEQICGGDKCAALAEVVCERPVKGATNVVAITIPAPRVNRLPLAECLQGTLGCGQQAADTFCRAVGLARATRFERSPDGTRSVHLGDQATCGGPQCRALINVACSR